MDNLEQLWCQSLVLSEQKYGKCVSCSSSEQLTCFITDTRYICVYNHENLAEPKAKQLEEKDLKHIRYLAVHNVIFLATDYELILCNPQTFECNVCYVSEKKIVANAWNPSETAVVIIDETDKLSLCNFSTAMFESQYSNNLNAEVPCSVYVGWGSENTQFQGPKSRQKVKDKVTMPVIEMKYTPPNISWRGNGQLFAVNYYKSGQRFIKVFDNQLQALNVSSEYPNLTEPIAFMFAGQCIACSAAGDVNSVVIFEKNCKVKSAFEVPDNKGAIVKMQYHPQINMLAVYSLDSESHGYINIYLNANGIWLLKQQLYFPPSRRVQDFEWINLHEPLFTSCRLVVFSGQSVEYYAFRFIISRSPLTSIVAVVDGRNISWYNFEEKIIPPPMSNYTLTHSRPINRILFHPQQLLCVALDAALQFLVIELNNFTVVLTVQNVDLSNILLNNVIWNDKKIQINVESCVELSKVCANDDITLEVNTVKSTIGKFALPYNDTTCLKSHDHLNMEKSMLIYLTKKVISIENSEFQLDFALSSNRELYVNDQVICGGITSAFIFKDYLLLTTASCKLYCLRLLENYENLLCKDMNFEKVYSREIEQGSRIVSVTNSYPPQIIMVLPRGNLETIKCRLLTIDIIENLLSENKWKTAVDITRMERLNWNLLVDLNPERFVEHIKDFVKAAEFSTNLSMIVNDFTDNTTFYTNCLSNFPNKESDKTEITRKIVEYLSSTDLASNLLSIVSIQQKHFSLKSALNYIKIVFEMNPQTNESICKKALQQLTNKGYFNDIIEATYNLYSLDFLLFVYHNSTEDPKVYEPEIAAFRKLKPIELRFKMSMKGNNPKEAIKYLVRCDNYDKDFVQSFIVKHKLEDVAYKSFPPFYEHFATVSVLYAKRLSLKQKHGEAAMVLKRAKLTSQALEEYKLASEWREVLGLMTILQYNEDERKRVLYYLSDRLSQASRVDEAVILLDKYIGDFKKAIQLLVEHKAFRKAICLATEYQATEILDELVVPSLKSYMLYLQEKIIEFDSTFKKYFNRLKTLREEKKIKLDNSVFGIYEGDDDLYSESGSTISSHGSSKGTSKSRSSQMSSKNKRKEEKKKIDLREGGFYEDIALIRALHILYNDVFSLGKDVREVCLILDHENIELAKTLHGNLSRLQDAMKNHISLIWLDEFVNAPHVLDNAALAIIGNKEDLDPVYRVPPGENILSSEWKLDIFS